MNSNRAKIVLASQSPRRKELLAQAGYEFAVCPSDIDEAAFISEGDTPCAHAERLAFAKAENVAGKFPDSLVIGADTIVDLNGRVIGKPADAAEAEEITRKLFSNPHKVITAVAIIRLSGGIKLIESDSTTVYPKKMSDQQIARHIAGGSWQDKAGAYAIQQQGDKFIERIDGSLTNVMGLPMELLKRMLDSVRP
jgi:septum formation protein